MVCMVCICKVCENYCEECVPLSECGQINVFYSVFLPCKARHCHYVTQASTQKHFKHACIHLRLERKREKAKCTEKQHAKKKKTNKRAIKNANITVFKLLWSKDRRICRKTKHNRFLALVSLTSIFMLIIQNNNREHSNKQTQLQTTTSKQRFPKWQIKNWNNAQRWNVVCLDYVARQHVYLTYLVVCRYLLYWLALRR